MTSLMRPELHAAAGNTASFQNRLDSTYKSGNVVQTSGATSVHAALTAGAMARVFEMTLQFCNDRQQFGRPSAWRYSVN